ncbi:3273_t:CDS:1, partial [Cetraspora pellucida]
ENSSDDNENACDEFKKCVQLMQYKKEDKYWLKKKLGKAKN